MENIKWLSIIKNSAEGEATKKNILSSGLLSVAKTRSKATKSSTQVTLDVNGLWKGTYNTTKKVYDMVEIPEASQMSTVGAPAIPQEGIYVAIPSGSTNIAIKVLKKSYIDIEGKVNLSPVPKQLTEAEYIKGLEEYKEDTAIYGADALYPGKDFEYIGTKIIEGVTVAHILVYLAQYKPKSLKLSVIQSITLEVSYTAPATTTKETEIKNISNFMQKKILDVNNVFSVKELLSQITVAPPILANLKLATVLKSSDKISEYVIIVSDDLKDSVKPLLNAKSGWPNYASTALTSQITKEFPAANLKESIKAFLTWAWKNWKVPPRYVVLAGDTDKIPVHMWTVSGETYASDHYYADIEGSMSPEIMVSRLPSSDPKKLTQICQNLADYPKKRGTDWGSWQNQVILSAYEASVYIDCSNDITAKISSRFKVSKKYGNSSTKQQVINEMNGGALIVNYRGHGSTTNWSSGNGLNTSDVVALKNQNMPPLVFCICCQNGWVDNNSITTMAEAFIREGKSVGVVAATRNSPTYANNDFNKYLFRAIMDNGNVEPGKIFNYAKNLMILNHPNSIYHQRDVVMYMLFGDPAADVASTVEFLRGLWDMDLDGKKGVLNINRIWNSKVEVSGGYGYPVWDISGTYTADSDGIQHTFTGKIGGKDSNDKNSGSKRSDHKIVFNIAFPGNLQKFEGYIMTWTQTAMAGLTWWSNRPFGWYCKKK